MRHHLLSSIIAATAMPAAPTPSPKPRKHSSNPNNNSSGAGAGCNHSPSSTLDLLILVLVVFSGSFLLTSYLSYIFHSLSLLLPLLRDFPLHYVLEFLVAFAVIIAAFEVCWLCRARRCSNPACKGLKKAMEFDLQLQTEDCLKSGAAAKEEIDSLPWRGGTEGNPDYECLREELRKLAPPNGRAVLLFRSRCGCPTSKLEGWGPKRGRRHKKSLTNVAQNGGDNG